MDFYGAVHLPGTLHYTQLRLARFRQRIQTSSCHGRLLVPESERSLNSRLSPSPHTCVRLSTESLRYIWINESQDQRKLPEDELPRTLHNYVYLLHSRRHLCVHVWGSHQTISAV